MTFGDFVRAPLGTMKIPSLGKWALALLAPIALLTAPQLVQAQASAGLVAPPTAAASPSPTASAAASGVPAEPGNVAVPAAPVAAAAGAPVANRFVVAPGGYTPMKPTPGKGMPVDGGYGFQTQYSPNGLYARWFHDVILLKLVFGVSIFVLILLAIVVVRFNSRSNPVPSKTSHNTLLEVAWTGIPVLILAYISVYSIDLLAQQYKAAPANALTVKATGNQWYWSYTYPDNGGIEVTSNILTPEEDKARGEPQQLGADYRMVVPAGEPIRLQTTGADVIHSFAVPSLWFKLDAVPGRINEKTLFINEPGVYYGQCSELCGVRHGYMPIVVEALDRPHFNAWVLSHKEGKLDGMPAAPAADAADAAAAPAAAPSPSPVSTSPAPAA
jgi:cytochrome c oxidase subunit 2